jgi:hypothetical protein
MLAVFLNIIMSKKVILKPQKRLKFFLVIFFIYRLVAMRDSRKLFRLFKTLNEYKKIEDLLKKNPDLNFNSILLILTRAFFGVYWIFDNLNILSKLKIIEKDPKPYGKTGAFFWLLALLTNLVTIIKDIIENEKKI